MTVTLSPELADLLDRTGHAWPAADEDRIVAMASSWRALGVGLDEVRNDHLDATRSVLAAGTGDAVAAFGDWGAELAALLLPLVEICARLEAWLISIAEKVYAAKTGIIGVLDGLARQIDDLRRDVAGVPILDDAVAKVIEPVYTGARFAISGIVNGLSAAVVDVLVPALVTVIEWMKGAVQGLRKLIRFEIGADWPTTPAGRPNPANKPHGPLTKPDPNDRDPVNIRSLRLENEAAAILAQAGFDVEQIGRKQGRTTPDYRINGKSFDCYSPTTPRARNIWDLVRLDKVRRLQADRVIINIDAPDAQANVADLRRQFQDYPIPGLTEAKVIAPGGAIIDIYP